MKMIGIIMRPEQASFVSLLFRFILSLVFIISALDKIASPAEFAIAVENYRIIPSVFTNTIAIFLPWIEFFCGLFLLLGIWQRGSTVIIAALSILFISAMISVLLRGLDIDCGCFGAGVKVDNYRIAEDIVLLLLALFLIKFPSEKFTLDRFPVR